jgi:FkbM family methyltransferase
MQTTSISTQDLPSEIALATRRASSRSRWLDLWAKLRSRAGHFSGRYIRPAIGFGFDLTGAVYRVDGCRFKIPLHLTDRNYRSAFVFGEYEAGERKLIRQYLRADDRVIELGGCIGVLSCLVNSRLTERTQHLVVEANPELIPLLRSHRELNRAGFEIETCAVSTEPEITFSVHRLMTHSSTFAGGETRRITVQGRSLADLHQSHGPFNVLLIDIEGSELEVLRASSTLLREYRLVIIELHQEQLGAEGLEECRRILKSVGLERSAAIHSVEAWTRPPKTHPIGKTDENPKSTHSLRGKKPNDRRFASV